MGQLAFAEVAEKPRKLRVVYAPGDQAAEYAALAVNLYRGCSYGCAYCFAPGLMRATREEYRASPRPCKDVLAKLRRDCQDLEGTNPPPIQLGFISDPYQPIDDDLQLTRRALVELKGHGLRAQILTKAGPDRVGRDLDLLGPGDRVGATLTLAEDESSLAWEPGAALPRERLAMLEEARARGLATWASMEPVLDPAQTLDLIYQAAPVVDWFAVGKLNHHHHAARIDWPRFARDAVDLLEALGCRYYLKQKLREAAGRS